MNDNHMRLYNWFYYRQELKVNEECRAADPFLFECKWTTCDGKDWNSDPGERGPKDTIINEYVRGDKKAEPTCRIASCVNACLDHKCSKYEATWDETKYLGPDWTWKKTEDCNQFQCETYTIDHRFMYYDTTFKRYMNDDDKPFKLTFNTCAKNFGAEATCTSNGKDCMKWFLNKEEWDKNRNDPVWVGVENMWPDEAERTKLHMVRNAVDMWHVENPLGCNDYKFETKYDEFDWLSDSKLDGKIIFEGNYCDEKPQCTREVDGRTSNCLNDFSNPVTWDLLGQSEIWQSTEGWKKVQSYFNDLNKKEDPMHDETSKGDSTPLPPISVDGFTGPADFFCMDEAQKKEYQSGLSLNDQIKLISWMGAVSK